MTFFFWRRWFQQLRETARAQQRRPAPRCRPRLERLENRLAPATTLSILNSSVIEPAPNGTVNMDFTVARTGDLTAQITVGYTTVAGTAQPNTDFTPTTGTTTFASGSATAIIAIPIFGNGVYNNPNLTFSVQLTGIVNVVGPPVTLAGQQTFTTGTEPVSVAVADLNHDGLPDLIVANQGSATVPGTVSVLLNTTPPGTSTPIFAAQQSFTTGMNPVSVAVADLNGDGLPDLIVANQGSGTVSVLLNMTMPGSTTLSFAAQQTFATGTNPDAVAVADLNGDGKPDLIVANGNSNTVSVLLNTTMPGSLTASFAPQQTFATGMNAVAVAVADVNGDGKPDLIVANQGSATVSVLLNTTAPGAATPSFATQQTFATGTNPDSVAVADVNGDGKPDLIVANQGSATVSVLLNATTPGAATPSFALQQTFATGTGPASVAVRDVNGDGKPDLVVANYGSNTVSLLVNTTTPGAATPSFASQQTFATGTGSGPESVAVADVNNDGKPDLIVANEAAATVSVLANTTTLAAAPIVPNFSQATFGTGSSPRSVVVTDVNGDGKPDLIIANKGSNTVSVLLNTTAPGAATPSFATQQTFATGIYPFSVAVGDINGDGKPDLLVANEGSNTVSVLLNTTATGATTPSFASQQTFATGTTPVSVAVADVNGDGKPDLVVANANANTVSVLLNTTTTGTFTASFAPQQTFATGSVPISVAVGDVNGDGKPDLVVANDGSATVSVLLNTTTTGAATASFALQQTFATGTNPFSVAVGDVNGDGKPDLVVANDGSATVSVLLNTTTPGAATASFAPQQTFATGSGPVSVAVADVNRDGKPDLLVANVGSATVSMLLNTTTPGSATASFAAQQSFSTGNQSASVAVADVNGDGMPDLIVANYGSGSVAVLLDTTVPAGPLVPNFPQSTFGTGTTPVSVAVADVNGDGKPDLVVANYGSSTVSVLLNTTPPGAATPTFAAQKTFATGTSPVWVAVADLNGDGKPDLIVANYASSTVSVLLNTTAPGAATPSFAPQQTFATGTSPVSVAVADLNGDGMPDLVVANEGSSTVSVLLNTMMPGAATPSFATQQTFATGFYPVSVAVADVNGDGKPDIVVANVGSNTVSVLLNTTTPGATTPTFATQQTFATGSEPFSVAVADVNGDGLPDIVVADYGSATVSVLLNTTTPGATTPSFANQQFFGTGNRPVSVAVADVNGDDRPDLVVANLGSATVSVLLNATTPGAGTASFANQQTFATGTSPFSVAVADVNGDGLPDLLAANEGSSTVSVLLNTPVTISTNVATGTIVDSDPPPDLTATKTDNVSGATTLGNSWTWTIVVTNSGSGPATFAAGQALVLDNLPNSNIGYGLVSAVDGSGTTGTVAASISSGDDLTATASGGNVVIPGGGTVTLMFTAMPSAIGTFANPRSGGSASVDPNNNVVESNKSNNTFSDSVTVTAPDLTATKTDNVSGATTVGNSWTWTIHVANSGNAPATFTTGQVLVLDNLPNSNISYGTVTVANASGVTGTLGTGIANSNLTATASGGSVLLAVGGSFNLVFTATPTAPGTFANPRSGGSASVDPNNNVVESNESNNTFSDSVVVSPGVGTGFHVVATPSTATAGQGFLLTIQAVDVDGNPTTNYSGTVSLLATDGEVPAAPFTVTNGFGVTVATLTTAGSWTIKATDTLVSTLQGISNSIMVVAGSATHFAVTATPLAIGTLTPFSYTVTAEDQYNNQVKTYVGTANFTSTDLAANFVTSSYHFLGSDQGTKTFTNGVTFQTPGNQTITATDASNASILGTSAAIDTTGFSVTSFASTPTGFTVTFSKPLLDPTSTTSGSTLHLYTAPGFTGAPDLTLVGNSGGTIRGTMIFTAPSTITFLKGGNPVTGAAAGLLAADTYTVTLVSSVTGFGDTSGEALAGDANGFLPGTNYTHTFIFGSAGNAPSGSLTVSLPQFARGPESAAIPPPLNVPNATTTGVAVTSGIPITLSSGTGVTDVTLMLTYNPNLLNISGTNTTSTPSGATFTWTAGPISGGLETDTLMFITNTAILPAGSFTLGGLAATVPSTAASSYKSKNVLQWISIVINSAAPLPSVGVNGLELVAYLGDTNGDGNYTGADNTLLASIIGVNGAGFAAYKLTDPVIIGDILPDGKIASSDSTQLNHVINTQGSVFIPPLPTGVPIPTTGPDPTVSIPTNLQVGPNGTVPVPVNIDDPRPAGSSGMTEAVLALTYDPRVFIVSSADIHLGTVPAAGQGWILTSTVNPVTGQIGIDLYSATPIGNARGGSLVTIDFHQIGAAVPGMVSINLAATVNPNGRLYRTEIADSQGAFTLNPAPTNVGNDPGVEGTVLLTPVSPTPAVAANSTESTENTVVANSAVPVENEDDKNRIQDALPVTEGATQKVPAAYDAVHGVMAALGGFSYQTNLGPAAVSPVGVGVFQVGNDSVSTSPANGTNAGNPLVDSWLLALARGTVDETEQPLAIQMRPSLSRLDNIERLLWDSAGADLDWQQEVGESTATRLLGRRREAVIDRDSQQATVQQAALDEYFAQVTDNLDEPGR